MSLTTALGSRFNTNDIDVTVAGHVFPAALDGGDGTVERVVGGTCLSITLQAGIRDDAGALGTEGVVAVVVQVGHRGGGVMRVHLGELVTQTFALEPGNFQLLFHGNPFTYVNGELTCTTRSGRVTN